MLKKFAYRYSILFFLYLTVPLKTSAQILPDNTLGIENSQINSINELSNVIEGGATRGKNLFHSFSEFSVPEGTNIDFANPNGITNIFSRVTGGNTSEILGTLRVNGNANLFLMNPNGIVFGENSAIDVGGSFMATTAESINFNNDNNFSAANPNSPLLTIDFPVGLGFGSSTGDILLKGEQNNVFLEIPSFTILSDNLPSSLKVDSRKSVSLLAENILFEGGGVQASNGNIEIGAISGDQTLKLLPVNNWVIGDYSNILDYGNITLSRAAYIDVSGEAAGNINLYGENISVNDGSAILANTSSAANSAINIHASQLLEIKGNSGENQINATSLNSLSNASNFYSISVISADVLSQSDDLNSSGNDININTKDLQILDAGEIRTISFSDFGTQAGNINISAEDILVRGTNNIDGFITSLISSSTGLDTNGNSGDVNIVTSSLKIEDGGQIKADTFSSGKGGQLNIEANSIKIETQQNDLSISKTGLSVSSGNKSGSSGDIDINTEELLISRGIINSSSFNAGEAGDININANKVSVFDGGVIEAEAQAGDGGNITIKAAQGIELNGTKEIVGNFVGGISTATRTGSLGKGGNIRIDTKSLAILNGSIIRAISLGQGKGGDIFVDADFIEISGFDLFANNPIASGRVSKINAGSIRSDSGNIFLNSNAIEIENLGRIETSTSQSNSGGEIFIDSKFVLLKDQGRIVANARAGNGGNVTINSDAILGIQNSDITANARAGNGGNITIDSDFIVGLEARPELTSESDITASSELGLNGNIFINSPNLFVDDEVKVAFNKIDFNSGEKLLSQSCLVANRSNKASSILVLGQNGFTENSDSFLDEPSFSVDPNVLKNAPNTSKNDNQPVWDKRKPLIEANTIQVTPDGRTLFVAQVKMSEVKDQICQQNSN